MIFCNTWNLPRTHIINWYTLHVFPCIHQLPPLFTTLSSHMSGPMCRIFVQKSLEHFIASGAIINGPVKKILQGFYGHNFCRDRTIITLTITIITNDWVYNPTLFCCLLKYDLQQVNRKKKTTKEASCLTVACFYCLWGNKKRFFLRKRWF